MSEFLCTVFAADSGTVFVDTRFDADEEVIYLGLSQGNQPDGRPEIRLRLTERQRQSLRQELLTRRDIESGCG